MNASQSLSAPIRFGVFDRSAIVRSVLAVAGGALLMKGVFLPTSVLRSADSTEQIVATQSYFDDATGDATFVFLLAVVLLVACAFQRVIWMRVTGAALLAFFAAKFANDLFAEPAFRIPLIDPTVNEGYGSGWLVLWAGAMLAACAGWIGYERPNAARKS